VEALSERGGNPEAIIEWQLPLMIPQDTYDLTIDTTNDKCVGEIMGLLDYPERFMAFKTLWSQRTV